MNAYIWYRFTADGNEAHSKQYHLLAADLRDISALEIRFSEIGIDKR